MSQLPTLADLHKDPQEAFKNDQFKLLLNQPPHQSWIKKNQIGKTEYLPIDKIEFLLDIIFQEWRVEILNTQALFNSICVTVRVHFKNPTTGEWTYQDGVGAAAVQVDKGAMAGDLSAIKNAAVQMAAPSAKSYAIKDACDHIGKLFGRDLNRKDTLMFVGAYSDPHPQAPSQTQPAQMPQPAAPKYQVPPVQHAPAPQPQYQAATAAAPRPAGVAPVQSQFSFNPNNL